MPRTSAAIVSIDITSPVKGEREDPYVSNVMQRWWSEMGGRTGKKKFSDAPRPWMNINVRVSFG